MSTAHRPSWTNIERRSLHCPYMRAAVTEVRQQLLSREEALIAVAMALSESVERWADDNHAVARGADRGERHAMGAVHMKHGGGVLVRTDDRDTPRWLVEVLCRWIAFGELTGDPIVPIETPHVPPLTTRDEEPRG